MYTVGYIAAVIGLSLIQGSSSQCPDGFERHGDSCYNAFALEASWIEAKLYCQTLGTDLVTIGSTEEETVVEGLVSRTAANSADWRYWTAGADILTEGQWRWMTEDGVSIPITGYTHWGHHRPDALTKTDNCMLIHYQHSTQNTYWDDASCQGRHSFVCEGKYDRVGVVQPFTQAPTDAPVVVTVTDEVAEFTTTLPGLI